ncbi:Hypothetical protein SMAX5B_017232 [Scophthalmus maximus]|uniref:Uncharacterized protein n=1 Tax=Scophthalmus maximus TaxID=52904 RepID=A0A2U9C7L0_SCOMX|nr:Hypothetical protein SMAX5B_017232 [Scophthalmus maximus]KAF0040265.1 hypothetical protein F2P81_008500 [Scophthalmus maximus]
MDGTYRAASSIRRSAARTTAARSPMMIRLSSAHNTEHVGADSYRWKLFGLRTFIIRLIPNSCGPVVKEELLHVGV